MWRPILYRRRVYFSLFFFSSILGESLSPISYNYKFIITIVIITYFIIINNVL